VNTTRGFMIATALAAVVATSVASADDKKYTMADLKALVAQNGFKEAVQHLGDISPSQRNADWLDVAGTACAGVLSTFDASDGSPIVIIDQIDREYPAVLKSPKYLKVRADMGIKGIGDCFQQNGGDQCLDYAKRFVDNSGGDTAVIIKVAKAVRLGTNGWPAIAFFNRALAKDKTACKDDDFVYGLRSGLALPADYPGAKDARTALATCWDVVKTSVMDDFDKETSADGYLHKNMCPFLMQKKVLSGLQAKQCSK
jgi:hypothetical protein